MAMNDIEKCIPILNLPQVIDCSYTTQCHQRYMHRSSLYEVLVNLYAQKCDLLQVQNQRDIDKCTSQGM